MEELLKLLKRIKPEIDFESDKHLIDNEDLDSFDIVSIVAAINDEFDVQITARDILPENFNSVEALYQLIKKIEEE